MTFFATLSRDDADVPVTVRARVQPYADAVDCPAEFRSRFAGRRDVAILEVIEEATGKAFETTAQDYDHLVSLAVNQATN